jgi:sec-independent protein translocase protein TatA
MNSLAFLQNVGPTELIIIFFVVLIFFGPKRLPALFASFGKSIREFKKATSEVEETIHNAMDTEAPKRPQTPPNAVAREVATPSAEIPSKD